MLTDIGIPLLRRLRNKVADFADYLDSWLDLWEFPHICGDCE